METNKSSNMLVVKDLLKINNNIVLLDKISFSIPHGSICAFVGENGAGKSTTIKCITGLYPITKGEITIDGIDSKNINTHNIFGYIPEKENFPKISGLSFLKEMGAFSNMKKKELNDTIVKYCKLFGIYEKINLSLFKMSSGQRKKVMIIQSLIHGPKLLIADEPTENLDPENREIFYNILKEFSNNNKTVFLSTHNLDEISRIANYIVIIKQGKIAYSGKIATGADIRWMYNHFKNTGETAHFSEANISNEYRYGRLLSSKQITEKEYELLVKSFTDKKQK